MTSDLASDSGRTAAASMTARGRHDSCRGPRWTSRSCISRVRLTVTPLMLRGFEVAGTRTCTRRSVSSGGGSRTAPPRLGQPARTADRRRSARRHVAETPSETGPQEYHPGQQLTPGAAELPADLTDRDTVFGQLSAADHSHLLGSEGDQRRRQLHWASIGGGAGGHRPELPGFGGSRGDPDRGCGQATSDHQSGHRGGRDHDWIGDQTWYATHRQCGAVRTCTPRGAGR